MSDAPEVQRPQRPGPIGGDMAAVLWGVARRLQLPALQARPLLAGDMERAAVSRNPMKHRR